MNFFRPVSKVTTLFLFILGWIVLPLPRKKQHNHTSNWSTFPLKNVLNKFPFFVFSHPDVPPVPNTTVYSDVTLSEFIPYWNIIENVPEQFRESHSKPTPMEQLNINNGNGQSFGYIVYRKSLVLKPGMTLTIRGHPRDLVQVMVNGVQVNDPIYNLADLGRNFGSWGIRDAEFVFSSNLEVMGVR